MFFQLYKVFFGEFKNIYGRFWSTNDGQAEYYLKLDGYYFCKKQNKTILIIRVRNKRTIERMPVSDVIKDRNLVRELHPADACIVGMLANSERNGLIDKNCDSWQKMKRFKQFDCFIKNKPLLQVSKKFINKENNEITVLRSPCLDKEIEVRTNELAKNEALLYALDAFQAVAIGYDASEFEIRKMH